jgi:general secretion pathway protein J
VSRGAQRLRGFTLVEVLVALAAMALLAVMAWRGVDAMGQAQIRTRERSEDVLALQAGLAQWRADLDAMTLPLVVGGIEFDGRVLRITRHVHAPDVVPSAGPDAAAMIASGMRVVAWGSRQIDGRRQWLRWQSAAVHTRSELQLAWQQAAQWGENPTDELRRHEVVIAGLDEWQVYYFRNDSWSSPLSSAAGPGARATPVQSPLPDGVRLVLLLSDGQALTGRLQHDWVRPTLGAARS